MKKIFGALAVCAVVALTAVGTYVGLDTTPKATAVEADAQFVYLSDLTAYSAKVGWGSLGLDKASNGSKISLKVEGSTVSFDKGIFAHATSNLVYDVSGLNFDYFTAYVGINTTSSGGNGVKFLIYTSKDGKNWDQVNAGLPNVTMPNTNATYVKVDIREANYLWLKADANGSNGNDHSAYGDAKLIKASYQDTATRTVEEYDALIAEEYAASGGLMNERLELLSLQRDLVKKTGQYQLKQLFAEGPEYKETFEWVFNNLENLKLYTMGGQPDGNYKASFEVLTRLRQAHAEDTEIEGAKGLLYKKMMLTLALTHSRTVNFWVYSTAGTDKTIPNPNISNAVTRYEIYKDLYEAGKLNSVFGKLEIEEMRYVLGAQINDDEIRWAVDYAKSKSNPLSGYTYVSYKNVNTSLYRQNGFFAQYADITKYETKYKLTGYNVVNEAYYPRLWMIMEVGGVCWQISNMGQSMASAMGVPSILIGQPGHSAYLVYSDSGGKSSWALWNNVGGWTVANTSAYNGTRGSFRQRLMATWGNGSYASGSTVTYIFLSAAAMDDYDNYTKAETEVRLAESLSDVNDKEVRYRKALAAQPINLDAWIGLINTYNANSAKTQDDYLALADEVASALKYYPHPMYDMLNLIGKKMTDVGHKAALARLMDSTLRVGAAAPTSVWQYTVVRQMANYFLGKVDTQVAAFSFDGENAGVLKLAAKYEGTEAAFDYRLSASDEWSRPYVTEGKIKLTAEEIAKINASDGIQVHLIGMDYEERNIYTIKIQGGTAPTGLYGNDLENRVIGVDAGMEWRMEGSSEWTSYAVSAPDLTGDKTVYVRRAATGTTLASAEQKFEFTQDEVDPKHVYIGIDSLSVYSFSSENVRANKNEYEYARNALDGNLNTHWHTDRTTGTDAKFIIIELAEEEYISRFEYVPVPNYDYGVVKEGEILVSTDAENWESVATVTDWAKNNATKRVDFDPVKAKYVKFVATKNYDDLKVAGANYFISAAMFNLYEDSTKTSLPAVRLEYDIRESTNQDVTVKLINTEEPEKMIVIDNNDGSDTYVFRENGEFTFEFSNASGEQSQIVAKVDWIDRTAPAAEVSYEQSYVIQEGGAQVEAVKVVIELSEEVNFLSALEPVIKESDTENLTEGKKEIVGYKYGYFYLERLGDNKLGCTLTYNSGFELKFADLAGNEGSAQVTVSSLTVTDGGQMVVISDGKVETGGTDYGVGEDVPVINNYGVEDEEEVGDEGTDDEGDDADDGSIDDGSVDDDFADEGAAADEDHSEDNAGGQESEDKKVAVSTGAGASTTDGEGETTDEESEAADEEANLVDGVEEVETVISGADKGETPKEESAADIVPFLVTGGVVVSVACVGCFVFLRPKF